MVDTLSINTTLLKSQAKTIKLTEDHGVGGEGGGAGGGGGGGVSRFYR